MDSLLDTYEQDMALALDALYRGQVVYLTLGDALAAEHGPGRLLSPEDLDRVSRVAAAIGSARAGEV